MGTIVNTNKLKKTIQAELLDDNIAFLTDELSLLLSRKKYNFCDNYDEFIAISFEYDYPFDFCFVGYPTSQLFDNWNETAIIQLPISKGRSISEILQGFYNVEQTTQEKFDPIY